MVVEQPSAASFRFIFLLLHQSDQEGFTATTDNGTGRDGNAVQQQLLLLLLATGIVSSSRSGSTAGGEPPGQRQ